MILSHEKNEHFLITFIGMYKVITMGSKYQHFI